MKNWHLAGEELLRQIENTSASDGEIAVWFLGQCGFAVKCRAGLVLIDPVLNDITEDGVSMRLYEPPFAPTQIRPDYVLCTHGHIDHLAGETIGAVASACGKTKFVIPSGCRKLALGYGLPESSLVLMEDGTQVTLDGSLRIAAFSAAHPEHVTEPDREEMALGYCLEADGLRLVHLGDTYLTERLLAALQSLGRPDVFLPPINGDDLFRRMRNCIGNMSAEEAAALAALLKARLSVPTHYDMIRSNTVDPLRFCAELRRMDPAACWKIPALGERIIIRKQE